MSQPPILDLLRFLISDHSVDRGSASTLIPCLHESISADVELLAAGTRRCGGTTFNLNAQDEHWEFPPGPLSAERLALVEAIFASVADMLPSRILIESTPSDDIVARLEDPDLVPEPSLVPVLRAAALIASAAYENFGLVVTTVDVAALDANRRELLWSLLTIDPADLRIAGEPTASFRSSAARRSGYRLPPHAGDSLRCAMGPGSAPRNAERCASNPVVREALDRADSPISRRRRVGVSRPSSWQSLPGSGVEEARRRTRVERACRGGVLDLLHERNHLQAGDGDSRAAFTRDLTLERVLQEVLLELGYRPRTDAAVIQDIIADSDAALMWLRSGRREAIRDLARLLRGRLVLVTVNFDQLIETDLGLPTRVHYRPQDFEDFRDEVTAYLDGDANAPIPVLKIHGSIDDPSSIIATIDRTFQDCTTRSARL